MSNQNLTEVIAILDRSGSMGGSEDNVIEGYNAFVAEQKDIDGECRFTLVGFDSKGSKGSWGSQVPVIETLYEGLDVSEVPLLNNDSYFARGGTPLNDAIGLSVDRAGERFAAMDEKDRPAKVVVFVSTDGAENTSIEFPGRGNESLRVKVKHQEDKYNWQFVFTAGNLDAYATGEQLGVAKTHTLSSGKSKAGTKALYAGLSRKMSDFRLGAVASMAYSTAEKKEIEQHSNAPKSGNVGTVETTVKPFQVTDNDEDTKEEVVV